MSHMDDDSHIRWVAIACQGGASHTAFTAGALKTIFQDYADQSLQHGPVADRYQIIGLSGTSGGSICAFLAWYGLLTGGPLRAVQLLDEFWAEGIAAKTFLEDVVLQEGGLEVLRTPWGRILQTMTELMDAPYVFNPQAVMDWWAALHVGPLADFIAPRPEHVNIEKLFMKRDSQGQPLVDENLLARIGEAQRKLQPISQIISELNVLPDRAKNVAERLSQIRLLAQQIDTGLFARQFHDSICSQLNDILGWQANDLIELIDGKEKEE